MAGCGLIKLLSCIILMTRQSSQVEAACYDLPNLVQTTETAPNGTVLLNVSTSDDADIKFDIIKLDLSTDHMTDLKSFFSLEVYTNNFTLKTTKELDLEYFYLKYAKNLIQFSLQIDCGAGYKEEVFLHIEPVNEYKPEFVKGPFLLEIREDAPLNEFVLSLEGSVNDWDVEQTTNRYFQINPYGIQGFGAEDYFKFLSQTSGRIGRNNVTLDYDTLSHKNLRLNISVSDGVPSAPGTMSSYDFVNITVLDVDDQAPYYVYPDCSPPCIAPPYSAATSDDYKGPLTIQPRSIHALDDDTLGTALRYNIKSGNEDGVFLMDPLTGTVQQLTSVRESGYMGAEFRLVVQVRKDIEKDLSAISILTVFIEGRNTNNNITMPPIGRSTEDEPTSDLLIPVVIMGVILALLLVALVVVAVLYRRKQKQMTVAPDTDGSEPQTEDEYIHTDREDLRSGSNERLVCGNKITLGIGTTDFPDTNGIPASRLPPLPLRDSATETMDETKKKRSRRRNKHKEPEIYDGTQEYNMGMENEFYQSTDKSRVKRSQRSYEKKTDPALWIKVPNDQPVEEGKL